MEGIPAAIARSPAVKAYFVNLMWQPGETTGFRASDHVRAIHRHAGGKFLDYAVVNIRAHHLRGQEAVRAGGSQARGKRHRRHSKMGVKVMAGNLAQHGEKVRHDPAAAAAVVVKLAQEGQTPQAASQP